MTKEELVQQLNQVLDMRQPLAHWQFPLIRKSELEEMVRKAAALRERAGKYQEGGENRV